jgi:hypothetical protein
MLPLMMAFCSPLRPSPAPEFGPNEGRSAAASSRPTISFCRHGALARSGSERARHCATEMSQDAPGCVSPLPHAKTGGKAGYLADAG